MPKPRISIPKIMPTKFEQEAEFQEKRIRALRRALGAITGPGNSSSDAAAWMAEEALKRDSKELREYNKMAPRREQERAAFSDFEG